MAAGSPFAVATPSAVPMNWNGSAITAAITAAMMPPSSWMPNTGQKRPVTRNHERRSASMTPTPSRT